jgi:hypothetical protein
MNRPETIASLTEKALQRRVEAVLGGAEWMPVAELGRRLDPQSKTPEEVPEQWVRSGKIFSIEHEGVLLVPAYLFDAQWHPLPGVAEILRIFDSYLGWAVAGWFESKNSYLGGAEPSRGSCAQTGCRRGCRQRQHGARLEWTTCLLRIHLDSLSETRKPVEPMSHRRLFKRFFIVEFTNLRPAPAVDEQPSVAPRAWRVFEWLGELRIAAVMDDDAIRLTSPVVAFNAQARALITSSGRVYSLDVPPTERIALRRLFEARLLHSGLDAAEDVSDLLWESFKAAEH